jgi:hypothetical protein
LLIEWQGLLIPTMLGPTSTTPVFSSFDAGCYCDRGLRKSAAVRERSVLSCSSH